MESQTHTTAVWSQRSKLPPLKNSRQYSKSCIRTLPAAQK